MFPCANLFRLYLPALIFFAVIAGSFLFAAASTGTIDGTYKYAWGENVGWINFGTTNGNIQIGDSALVGYAWSENYGWINLAPSQSGVKNDGSGNLSGYAWGEKLGYIDFGGVTISSTGTFTGIASGTLSGRINFDCTNCRVVTDWSATTTTPSTPATTTTPVTPGTVNAGGGGTPFQPPTAPATPHPLSPQQIAANIGAVADEIAKIWNIINPFKPPAAPAPEIVLVPEVAPPPLQGQWDLLSPHALGNFVLAPLPREIAFLTEKFPQLEQALTEVGVSKAASLPKLQGVELTLPGLGGSVGLPQGEELAPPGVGKGGLPQPGELTSGGIGRGGLLQPGELLTPGIEEGGLPQPEEFGMTGIEKGGLPQFVGLTPQELESGGNIVRPGLTAAKLGLPLGIPLVELTTQFKRGIPTEIVFARSSDERIDLDIKLNLNQQGQMEKRINAVAGTILKLVVKPEGAVDSVKGYLVLRARTRPAGISEEEKAVGLRTALASLIFQAPDLAQSISRETATDIEERLALVAFEYTDPDGDGIYTADVQVPRVDGEYDIITLISYKDPDLGVRQIGLTAVVDPEGYVYEKVGNNELRISHATVSLFRLNPVTNIYELWPGKEYSQENPQVTDVRGAYAFLVPFGSYYITVSAPGYSSWRGESFDVEMGNEIHDNIELHPSGFWANWDWKTALLILVGVLLLANFYWDKRRERSLTP